jgi:hypothetical protein
MADETWNPVPTHPGYSASIFGDVRGPRGKNLKPMRTKSGHLYVLTPRPRNPRKLFVHRAVLLAHVGPPPSPEQEGRHGDGNPENNAIANLCWGTRLENMQDKARHGTEPHGEAKPGARLTAADIPAIRSDKRAARTVGAEYGVSHTAILRIRRGERWRAA